MNSIMPYRGAQECFQQMHSNETKKTNMWKQKYFNSQKHTVKAKTNN